MKKYISYLLVLMLFAACSDTDIIPVNPEENPDGLIKINVITPQIASARSSEPMPANSTIRLYVFKFDSWATDSVPFQEKTYRVRSDGTTVLCAVDPDTGKPLLKPDGQPQDSLETALHLPANTYNFYSVSPAIKLRKEETWLLPGAKIYHGNKLNLRTSKKEQVKVDYNEPEIGSGTQGIFNLKLNTHTLLTARLTFKLLKGDKIRSMEFVDTEIVNDESGKERCVAIDKLPPDNYNLYNFRIGNNRLIPLLAETGDGVVGLSTGDVIKGQEVMDGYAYYFYTEVLPCRLLDSTGKPIQDSSEDDIGNYPGSYLERKATELRLHLNVSENADGSDMNYKMFTVYLPEESYLRGKSYNYTLRVNISGILVSSWNTSDWQTTIE